MKLKFFLFVAITTVVFGSLSIAKASTSSPDLSGTVSYMSPGDVVDTTTVIQPTTAKGGNEIVDVKIKDGKLHLDGLDDVDGESSFNNFFEKYRGVITAVSGIATLTMVVFFILGLIKLAKSGDNPTDRKKASGSIIVTGIAMALLGSLTFFTGIFYNFLR